jgi:hypothetical protein
LKVLETAIWVGSTAPVLVLAESTGPDLVFRELLDL